MTDQESRNLTVLELQKTADNHLIDAQKFAETVESASSLFVRESAFTGLRFAAEQCRSAISQIQSEFLSDDETLVQSDQLQAYNVVDRYCVETEAKLVELNRKAAATTYHRRRRLAAISAIVAVCLVPISWLALASFHKVTPTTLPLQSEKESVGSKYFQAHNGERLRALSGNSFDVYRGGLITAEALSSGTVNDGGVAVVKDGAMVTAMSGSTVYVYPGGTVVAEAGSEIIAAQGAIIQKKDGSAKVTFQQPAEWPNLIR